mmetsp:Transcript_27393/g.62431  ORF Transcript_27393/g.62431 Transcript_27393/m.62431 type:complete len:108 (+) Transcript_27393:82-405(+)
MEVCRLWEAHTANTRSDSESHGQNGILRRRYGGAAVGFTGVFSSSSALLKISFKIGMWPHSVRNLARSVVNLSQVPPGWTAETDDVTGEDYYVNLETGMTSWSLPRR